jgi:hypothetical protein
MSKKILWQCSRVSPDGTHHENSEGPIYAHRFQQVLSFHPPGLAPAKEYGRWFHIRPDGTPAYSKAFDQVFGFYQGRAAVEENGKWFHVLTNGDEAYESRFSWCGNFQQGLCVVRDLDGFYYHIGLNGREAYPERYLYVGDFSEGIAVAKRKDGLCFHIRADGSPLTDRSYVELGAYHKGCATARDSFGWFHLDKVGNQLYEQRYSFVEPFYNGLALCTKMNGEVVRVNTDGEEVETIKPTQTQKPGRKMLLIGNLSSGKPTLGRELERRTSRRFVRIDDCRRKMANGSTSGEYRAWEKFMEFCESPEGCILEFSGGGPHVYDVARALELSGSETYIILLDAPIQECISVSKERIFDSPYPRDVGDLKKLILHIDKEIKTAWDNVWTKGKFKTLRIIAPRENAVSQSLKFLGEDF